MYVHGADSGANIVQIDGADMSPALMSGVRYVGLNVDSIDDIQIKTAGIDSSGFAQKANVMPEDESRAIEVVKAAIAS